MNVIRIRNITVAAVVLAAVVVTATNNASARTVAPRAPKTWVVKMITDEGKQLFVPEKLTIQVGDTVSWLAVSGSHDVGFWVDSVPKSAVELLRKAMPDTVETLLGPRKPKKGDTYVVAFTGMPKGEYKYYCKPHLKKHMVGELTIQ